MYNAAMLRVIAGAMCAARVAGNMNLIEHSLRHELCASTTQFQFEMLARAATA